jgi:hypothetical protein
MVALLYDTARARAFVFGVVAVVMMMICGWLRGVDAW